MPYADGVYRVSPRPPLSGTFDPVAFTVPYSSQPGLAGMSGEVVTQDQMWPPYLSRGMGDAETPVPVTPPTTKDFLTQAQEWVTANPVLAGVAALGVILLLKKR